MFNNTSIVAKVCNASKRRKERDIFKTIWSRREDQFANFLATTPFTLHRCLAKLLDIFRCGFRRPNPKTLLEVIGYFDFPKISSKKHGSELIFAQDSEASKISKWWTFYAPLKSSSTSELRSRRRSDVMMTGSFLWLARVIPWPP